MKNPHIPAKVLYVTEGVEREGITRPHKGDAFIPMDMMPCFGFYYRSSGSANGTYWVYRPNHVVEIQEIPFHTVDDLGTCVRLSDVLKWLKNRHEQEACDKLADKVRRAMG